MYSYEVGQLYHPDRTTWGETPQYNYRGGGHELVLFYGSPTSREIRDVRRGLAQFAFAVEEGVIFFLYRFGEQPWSDAPYSIHLVPEAERTVPPPEATSETRALLNVHLVDADTGLIRANRTLSLSPEFTRGLNASIREQAARPFGVSAHERAIRRVYARYPTTRELLDACGHRTVGGA